MKKLLIICLVVLCGAALSCNFNNLSPIAYYTLTILVEGDGSVLQHSQAVTAGEEVTISASPECNNAFFGWTVVSGTNVYFVDETAATTTVILTSGDAIICANFDECMDLCTLTILTEGDGSVSNSSQTVIQGEPATITAIPECNGDFLNWSIVSGTNVSFTDQQAATTTVILNAGDATIRANFVTNSLYVVAREERFSGTPYNEHLCEGEVFDMGPCPRYGNINLTVSMENWGSEQLTITGVSITGDPTDDLALWPLPGFPVELDPGEAEDFGIDFAPDPDIAADYQATVTIHNNDPYNSEFSFIVTAQCPTPPQYLKNRK
jgi:hypothetical protein